MNNQDIRENAKPGAHCTRNHRCLSLKHIRFRSFSGSGPELINKPRGPGALVVDLAPERYKREIRAPDLPPRTKKGVDLHRAHP